MGERGKYEEDGMGRACEGFDGVGGNAEKHRLETEQVFMAEDAQGRTGAVW